MSQEEIINLMLTKLENIDDTLTRIDNGLDRIINTIKPMDNKLEVVKHE